MAYNAFQTKRQTMAKSELIIIEKIPDVGTIVQHTGRDNMLYLRGSYRGKDFNRSLNTKAPSEARKWAKGKRKQIEREREAERVEETMRALLPVPVETPDIPVSEELYREFNVSGSSGFFETFYSNGNPNTRYDAEKVLRAWFRAMGKALGKEEVRLRDLKRENLTVTYNRLTQGIRYRNKIFIAVNKFLTWEMDNGRIPREDYLRDIKKKVPNMGDIFSDRQEKLGEEKWTEEELKAILTACSNPNTPHVHKWDYELYFLMRYMGLPPVDVICLKPEDFLQDSKQGLVFRKTRAKVKTARYYQPLDKGDKEHDREVIRIIRARLAVTRKGEYLFPQEMISSDAHLAKIQARRKQDDRTRWVSNFSDRRARLQKHLGIAVKGSKGLRATFASWWIKHGHIPERDLAVWLGHAPGSVMIRMFYSEVSDHGHFKLTA